MWKWVSFIIEKGDDPPPLRTAYRPNFALRTAYRQFWASRTAYGLTTKTILGVFIYINKMKRQYFPCICTIILANISFDVFASQISEFKFIMKWPPKKRVRIERAKYKVTLHWMSRLLCFLMKIKPFYVFLPLNTSEQPLKGFI